MEETERLIRGEWSKVSNLPPEGWQPSRENNKFV